MKIEDCVALVTGGSSGLGEACARNFVGKGAKSSIVDLATEKGMALAQELGPSAIFCKANVSDEKDIRASIERTVESLGVINVVVCCAGISLPAKVIGKEGPLKMEDFNRVIQVNLLGTMNVIRLAAEKISKNTPNQDGERGVIITTASAAAFEGQIGQASYSASKAGIVGLTLPIAREFADYGIRVVTIAPGLFNTPMLAALPEKAKEALGQMIPFPKRLGRPSEFASLVEHIIENPMINGETIRLDGALRMAAR